jgi:putative ABC transport system permease protein
MLNVALKMLFSDRLKYFGLVAGIAFATMLIVQQASILVGFTKQTGSFIRDTAQADLWLMDPQVRFAQDPVPLRDTALQMARGVPGVWWAMPLYQGFQRAKLPDGTRVTMILIGLDDATLMGGPPLMVQGALADLRRDKAVLIDAGTAEQKLMMKRGGNRALAVGDRVSIGDHDAVVAGSYRARSSFFWEPVVYTTYSRALKFAPEERNMLSFVMIKLAPGADRAAVQREIAARTGLAVRDGDEFATLTAEYILKATGILINFGMAVALGILIGSLVAGQTFYNFTLDNLRHYGALKAMGVSNARLTAMVLLQAAVVAVLGYAIGAGLGAIMGLGMAESGLAFSMPWQVPTFALAAILAVCALAAWLSLRRVHRLEPAIVFKA